jgi:ACT domain
VYEVSHGRNLVATRASYPPAVVAPYAAFMTAGAVPERARRDVFTRFLVRVWLPDRPGALGAVASRIGALGADIVGIDVLEQGDRVAVDEFAITLLRPDLIDLLTREIEEVDGVSVEAWRRVERFPDPRLDFLRLVEDLIAAPDLTTLETRLVTAIVSEFTAEWSAIVAAAGVLVAAGEPIPPPEVLEALAAGTGASPLVASGVTGPDDLAVAPMPARRATLLAGRDGHPFRALERRQILSLARIADRLPALGDTD